MRIRSLIAAASLAAVAFAVGLPGASTTADAATATTSATATPAASAVSVSVAPANDGVLTATSDLSVTISVHNPTKAALAAGDVRVYLDKTSFSSRSQLDAWFDRPATTTTDVLGLYLASAQVPEIAAGGTSDAITVTVPSAQLGLAGGDWGAKAFGVRYSSAGVAVSEAHSSLVVESSSTLKSTALAVAVPLTVPASTSGLIGSAALASYTAPTGILTEELKAVRGRDVAIGIDPMILASIRLLGNAAPPSAIVWLNSLVTAPNQTFALAYGDSDLSAVRQAGATTLPTPIDFTAAIAAQAKADPESYVTTGQTTAPANPDAGQSTAATATATPTSTPTSTSGSIPPTSSVPTTASLLAFDYTLTKIAWPLEDTVASDDLTTFAASGYSTTILSSDNVSESGNTTADSRVSIAGGTGLVSDDGLSDLLNSAVQARNSDSTWRSDVAQLSAELATLTYESPTTSRTLLATMDRGWATNGDRMAQTIAALSSLGWVKQVGLTSALTSTSTDATLSAKKASATRIAAIQPLVAADTSLVSFATALQQPQIVTAPERLRMLALTSTAWRSDTASLQAEAAKVTASVTKTLGQVSIVQGSPINILGDRSSLPISIRNDTASVAVVTLRVVPSNYYLTVEKNDVTVTVQPNSQQRVTVPVQSVANGKVNLTVSLSSASGVAISTPTRVAINVQAGWETAITLGFGIAVVLLFGGGIYRSLRRRRKASA